MGIKNLGWFDSRHRLTGITPEQFDLGWPHCLSSADIATLQRPVPADKKGVQATFYAMGPVSDLWAAIASTCPTDHTGKIGAEIVHFHNAPAFAAWLAGQQEDPSKAIAAWFKAVGVAGAGVPAPVTNTTVQSLPTATWCLIPVPARLPGYRWPLYQFLDDKRIAGNPCPKAQHVLNAWKITPPHGIEVVTANHRDELEYEIEVGTKKRATVKQIQAVIKDLLAE